MARPDELDPIGNSHGDPVSDRAVVWSTLLNWGRCGCRHADVKLFLRLRTVVPLGERTLCRRAIGFRFGRGNRAGTAGSRLGGFSDEGPSDRTRGRSAGNVAGDLGRCSSFSQSAGDSQRDVAELVDAVLCTNLDRRVAVVTADAAVGVVIIERVPVDGLLDQVGSLRWCERRRAVAGDGEATGLDHSVPWVLRRGQLAGCGLKKVDHIEVAMRLISSRTVDGETPTALAIAL